MRNMLLTGVMVSALALVAVPARAQVAYDEGYVPESSYGVIRAGEDLLAPFEPRGG